MNKTARRRVIAGFITDPEHDFPDPRYLRRDSPSGPRAFMSSIGSGSLRSVVITPESIPPFTIPKQAVQEPTLKSAKDRNTQPRQNTARKLTKDHTDPLHLYSSSSSSSSSASSFRSSPALARKAQRSISDPESRRRTSVRYSQSKFLENDQCSDRVIRGALSLPHLAKITTPYGFVTLSQSPQMANEEELFLQTDYRSWARDKKNKPFRNLSVEMKTHSDRTLPAQSHTAPDSHQMSRGTGSFETSACSGSFPPPAADSSPKHRSNRKFTQSI